jgi:hypothetical protein
LLEEDGRLVGLGHPSVPLSGPVLLALSHVSYWILFSRGQNKQDTFSLPSFFSISRLFGKIATIKFNLKINCLPDIPIHIVSSWIFAVQLQTNRKSIYFLNIISCLITRAQFRIFCCDPVTRDEFEFYKEEVMPLFFLS